MQEPFLSERPRALSPKLPGVVSKLLVALSFSIIKDVIGMPFFANLESRLIGKSNMFCFS
jgi:hypothetical protein